MNENIDWEDMMIKTERSATGAAKNAERTVGGVAKVLEEQRLHSLQLTTIEQALAKLDHQQTCHRSQTSPPADSGQGEAETSFRFLALAFVVVFAVGMGLGAYFVS
jgi:hypothetical protein